MSVKGFSVNGQIEKYDYTALDNIPEKAPVIIDTASGAVAFFPDGADNIPVKSLVVDIEPVQDLHGYDNPWPAGGGVNLLPPFPVQSTTQNGVTLTCNNGEYTLDGTTGTSAAVFDVNIDLPAGQYTVALNNPIANEKVQIYGIDENVSVPLQRICSTANATATAMFSATVKKFRIRVLVNGTVDNFKFSPVLSAGATAVTGFYPYENICPISGFSGETVRRTARNLFDSDSILVADGWTKSDGVYSGPSQNIKNFELLNFPSGYNGQITVSLDYYGNLPNRAGYVRVIYTDGTVNQLADLRATEWTHFSGSSKNNAAVSKIIFLYSNSVNMNIKNFQIELGSAATDYEPYQGDTYDIAFPTEAGTVYGATLGATAGKLTVNRAIVDMGTIAFGKSSSTSASGGSVFTIPCRNVGVGMAERARYTPNNMLSDVYKTASPSTWLVSELPDLTMLINTNALIIADSRYSTAADFRAAVSGVQLCYELATPIVYDLTPTEVTTLLAQNNIWADTGDSTVKYQADTKLYIDKKFAAIPTASGASF